LFAEDDFLTAEGKDVYVIDPGLANTDAGPDFFNAKVKIGETVWVGNVELHVKASDWVAHGHQSDKMYNNVVLHVVRYDDAAVCNANDETVVQAVMNVPPKVEDNIEWLLSRDTPVACAAHIFKVSAVETSAWLTALLIERLERKTGDVNLRLEQNAKDWNETFYITLMRSFGFGTNSDICERLAKSLPLKYILKHRNSSLQTEALLFGQAGLTEENPDDDYCVALKREYDFLSKKYGLRSVEGFLFRNLRTRPSNFPHVRLAQAAAVWVNKDLLFSKTIEADNLDDLRLFFDVEPSEYWLTHYNFRTVSVEKKKSLGRSATDIILINTVIPMLFAYGKCRNMPELCGKALRFLEELPAEKNAIVSLFGRSGVKVRNAGDSQALIQLRKEYCDRKRCLDCRTGYKVISN